MRQLLMNSYVSNMERIRKLQLLLMTSKDLRIHLSVGPWALRESNETVVAHRQVCKRNGLQVLGPSII